MTQERSERLIWLWLAAPLALFAVIAGWLWWAYRADRERIPAPINSGPFHLRAWLPPAAYDNLWLVEYIAPEGAALAVGSQPGYSGGGFYGYGSYGYGGFESILKLMPDAKGGLQIVDRLRCNRGLQPLQLTEDGRVLVEGNSLGFSATGTPPNQGMQLIPSPDASQPGRPAEFDFGFRQGNLYWYTLLDPQRIAVLEEPTLPGGKARLRMGRAGVSMPLVQELDQTLVCGDAWENGPTLALLAQPGKLFVVDRQTERLVERPEYRALAAAAIKGTPRLWRMAYSGGCIITQSSSNDALRLFSSDGDHFELRIIDARTQNPDGSHRLIPLGGVTSLLPLPQSPSYSREQVALRREGRRAPLSVLAGDVGNNILPIGRDRFVIADQTYVRLTVIEHTPQHAAGSGPIAEETAKAKPPKPSTRP
jgi:hypothetical protein